MKKLPLFKIASLSMTLFFTALGVNAQTNVYDDVIATSPNHTYLDAALQQEGLVGALQNPSATLTVFAPDNTAFDNLAAALNTDINGLLALPNLSDVLTYHVLGVTVPAAGVNNGAIVTPLNTAQTLKLTKTSTGDVYANQAQVNGADLTADNGVVHSIDAVVLPVETVVDVAIDNNFTSLTTAVVTAELLPVLTDPAGTFTVFAPTDQAFDDIAAALNTDIAGVLALPNLADILTYHVLGAEVLSSGVTNGLIAQPVSTTNTLKMTVTGSGEVYANQAEVTSFDIMSDNGVVHVLDAVVLPNETVVDVAIDNNFTSLTTAVVTAELLPTLTNPFAEFTVFAPTDQAFDNLATALNTDIAGILALPNLADILLYHTVSGTVLSTGLVDGPVATVEGNDILVDLSAGVMINDATVATPDVTAENGVVHVIDKVLIPGTASIDEYINETIAVYPNPSSDEIHFSAAANSEYVIINVNGTTVKKGASNDGKITISELDSGNYFIRINDGVKVSTGKFVKK
ncbi:MAG: fasciclin domain-containing protein [Crocinitomicaceae bacterium]